MPSPIANATPGMYQAMLLNPLVGRRAQNFFAVLLHEILNDQVVGLALGDVRVQFLEHRAGRRAVDVIALRENLAAAAHAHQLRAQGFGAIGFLRVHVQGNESRGDAHARGADQRKSPAVSHDHPAIASARNTKLARAARLRARARMLPPSQKKGP